MERLIYVEPKLGQFLILKNSKAKIYENHRIWNFFFALWNYQPKELVSKSKSTSSTVPLIS